MTPVETAISTDGTFSRINFHVVPSMLAPISTFPPAFELSTKRRMTVPRRSGFG